LFIQLLLSKNGCLPGRCAFNGYPVTIAQKRLYARTVRHQRLSGHHRPKTAADNDRNFVMAAAVNSAFRFF